LNIKLLIDLIESVEYLIAFIRKYITNFF